MAIKRGCVMVMNAIQGWRHVFTIGGGGSQCDVAYARCRRQCIDRGAYQDGLSWHLRALYCAFQMYEDRCCARSATRFAYITRLAESA